MIVIPMAGMSSRFFKEGYTKPKYMLELNGKTLFDLSLDSFKHYFLNELFVFVVRDIFNTREFIKERVKILGIKKFDIVVLNSETRGQAETVMLGLKDYKNSDEPLTIFNIDTFRPNFKFPKMLSDGYLEVFEGEGDNWSYVRPVSADSNIIDLTTEKNPISNLCCTGLYYFSTVSSYSSSYEHYLSLPETMWEKGELYVAPLYNFLISKGLTIRYNLIDKDEVIFCGTPKEYQELLN